MSAANSSAKKRRAPPSTEPIKANPSPNTPMNSPANTGLTLPQVISLIDKRLINLETVTKNITTAQTDDSDNNETVLPEMFMEELQSRFDIMADEIANLKNIVLKLQTYTMDVNKILLENANIVAPTSVPQISIHEYSQSSPSINGLILTTEEEEEEDVPAHPVTTVKWSTS
uniref:Uncharacterized protein n=1 Tax=viral metagenome TaxID=1070528 RepID=A0A6C0HVE2_9ZZZZ